jgi:xanthine dehydrogenase accessory factor
MADRSTVAWLDALAQALASDGEAELAVVAAAQGPTPRETGAAMVVSRGACAGTIGGGQLEYEATRVAREALAQSAPRGAWSARYSLSARHAQGCGGVATVAFAKLDRSAFAWLEPALACSRTGASFALVSRANAKEPAQRLVVTADDVRGTLGDASLDSAAIALARTRLAGARAGTALVRSTNDAGAQLLLQVERPDAFPVLLFGNGHVGAALVDVLGVVPAHLTWIDARAENFPVDVPNNVDIFVTDRPQDALPEAPAGAFVVVMTHSHDLDFTLIETALARSDWRYLGMIGSTAKRAQLERHLADRGLPADAGARIRCPIGTEGVAVKGKHPGSIAIAIAAELLVVREVAARTDPAHRIAVVRER